MDTRTLHMLSDVANEIEIGVAYGTMQIDSLTQEACNPVVFSHSGLLRCPTNAQQPQWGVLGNRVVFFWVYGRSFCEYAIEGYPNADDVVQAAECITNPSMGVAAGLCFTSMGAFVMRIDRSMTRRGVHDRDAFVANVRAQAASFIDCHVKTPASYVAHFKSTGFAMRFFPRARLDKTRCLSLRRGSSTNSNATNGASQLPSLTMANLEVHNNYHHVSPTQQANNIDDDACSVGSFGSVEDEDQQQQQEQQEQQQLAWNTTSTASSSPTLEYSVRMDASAQQQMWLDESRQQLEQGRRQLEHERSELEAYRQQLEAMRQEMQSSIDKLATMQQNVQDAHGEHTQQMNEQMQHYVHQLQQYVQELQQNVQQLQHSVHQQKQTAAQRVPSFESIRAYMYNSGHFGVCDAGDPRVIWVYTLLHTVVSQILP